MNFINLAFYKFLSIPEQSLPEVRATLLQACLKLSLKGTILLSSEGINCFIAGSRENIDSFKSLETIVTMGEMPYKESLSDHQPFTRMLVKIKKEIITMGQPDIQPADFTGNRISATEFKKWMDENRDVVILDTRNDYEVRLGTFKGAVDMNLQTFRQFPERVEVLDKDLKDKTIVTFCTGGIRCEKATAYLLKQGFKDVYQLDGGILRYFEEVGESHYDGECFVFDYRVALDPALNETETVLCFNCQAPVTSLEQKSASYVVSVSCPSCINGKNFHKEQIAQRALR